MRPHPRRGTRSTCRWPSASRGVRHSRTCLRPPYNSSPSGRRKAAAAASWAGVRPVTIGGITYRMPVCHARAHICEVDALPLIIAKLPQRKLFRLRDELVELIRWPDPPPFRFATSVLDVAPASIARINSGAPTSIPTPQAPFPVGSDPHRPHPSADLPPQLDLPPAALRRGRRRLQRRGGAIPGCADRRGRRRADGPSWGTGCPAAELLLPAAPTALLRPPRARPRQVSLPRRRAVPGCHLRGRARGAATRLPRA